MAGRILIVDDVATNRIVLQGRDLVPQDTMHMLAADRRRLPCAWPSNDLPDLVILRPRPSRHGRARRSPRDLRADPATRDTPVLLTATAATLALRHGCLAQRAQTTCMTKPVDEHRLLARMRALHPRPATG